MKGKRTTSRVTKKDAVTNGVSMIDLANEIDRATEKHQVAEQETAEALAKADKAKDASNGTEGLTDAKPAERPQYLTADAHRQRKLDVLNSGLRRFAAEPTVRAHFDKLVVAGRPADQPLTLGEYRAYLLEAQQSGTSTSDKPRMFTNEAFQIIKHLYREVKEALFKKFDGQVGVGVTDEFLIAVAEASVENDTKFSLTIDGEPRTCGNPECNRRFVPIRGITSNAKGVREFGNFRRVGTQIVAFCSVCKDMAISEARENNQPSPWFSPKSYAEKSAQYQEEKRNTNEGLRSAMGASDNFRRERDQKRDNRKQAGKFNPELAAKSHNPFAALLNNREKDFPTGRYYSPEFEMQDKRTGKSVRTFLDLAVSKHSLIVSDAGPVLADLIGSTHNTGYFENKLLFVGLNKAAEAQQA
ncbi:MAG TPA: hypothetical protein VJH05_00400 [Candidatus Paceibacterota bacterium]